MLHTRAHQWHGDVPGSGRRWDGGRQREILKRQAQKDKQRGYHVKPTAHRKQRNTVSEYLYIYVVSVIKVISKLERGKKEQRGQE